MSSGDPHFASPIKCPAEVRQSSLSRLLSGSPSDRRRARGIARILRAGRRARGGDARRAHRVLTPSAGAVLAHDARGARHGSAWSVDRSGRAAVLLHHRKLDRWLQPGGHADGDPDVRAVAWREAREETALASLVPATEAVYDVDVHDILARGAEPAHKHYDVRFAFFADRDETPPGNLESHAVRWVDLADLDRYAVDGSVRRLAAKTRRLAPATMRAGRPRSVLAREPSRDETRRHVDGRRELGRPRRRQPRPPVAPDPVREAVGERVA